MKLYCLAQAHADDAHAIALALAAQYVSAWPEPGIDARAWQRHRRELFAPNATSADDAVLIYDEAGLALQTLEWPLPGPVRVDFADAGLQRRARSGHAAGESVARACGIRQGSALRVLDATAGLGRDSWLLASLGATVEMLERVPLVHALLADGLRRAQHLPLLLDTAARLSLHANDAAQVLQASALLPADQRPDVVYLDPMFPHRDKSAKVKKDMSAFRQVVGADEDADALLGLARAVARKRVVVKRPRIAPDLNDEAPHQRMLGQSSRFDLYTPKPQ